MRALLLTAGALVVLAAASPAAGADAGSSANAARLDLADARSALVFGDRATAQRLADHAAASFEHALHGQAGARAQVRAAMRRAMVAAGRGDETSYAEAAATAWTETLRTAFRQAIAGAARGDVAGARTWLLVREFRPPTRFTRAGADATTALDALAAGRTTPKNAAAAVRRDLLDTYDSRLRAELAAAADARGLGFAARRAEATALARGYWRIVEPVYGSQRGAAAARSLSAAFATGLLQRVSNALAGFRAAPLSAEEQVRRAAQLRRFLKLVPIEYGRGVRAGRVVADFEIQEAITFRDGAASAFADLESRLTQAGTARTRTLGRQLDGLGAALAAASRGSRVANPAAVEHNASSAVDLFDSLAPGQWLKGTSTADFDVISATLDRLEAAAASGEWGRAESARLEAYGVFELGPEQRLRGLAPGLFQKIEGLFWYGASGRPGLVQLIKSKASAQELTATRQQLDAVLGEAEERIGAGPGSRVSVISNSAIIVFREGLEAVLILAALTASLVAGQRGYRKPLLGGAVLALGASAVTWVVAQTVLDSLAGFGERLEAIVSLVAIGVLLLILNWFYHRIYWQENLQSLHRKKRSILTGVGVSLAAAQVLGLVALGFSSVYREGFETVLFLQALTLEAGPWTVLQGVAVGLAATVGVGFLVLALERRLPHKKMLVATGLLITWVLIVLVGGTIQTMQAVGWLPVSPVEGLTLPYWAGLWLGVYPTWEGLAAQTGAAVFVLGSYWAAEQLRRRRRARVATRPAVAR